MTNIYAERLVLIGLPLLAFATIAIGIALFVRSARAGGVAAVLATLFVLGVVGVVSLYLIVRGMSYRPVPVALVEDAPRRAIPGERARMRSFGDDLQYRPLHVLRPMEQDLYVIDDAAIDGFSPYLMDADQGLASDYDYAGDADQDAADFVAEAAEAVEAVEQSPDSDPAASDASVAVDAAAVDATASPPPPPPHPEFVAFVGLATSGKTLTELPSWVTAPRSAADGLGIHVLRSDPWATTGEVEADLNRRAAQLLAADLAGWHVETTGWTPSDDDVRQSGAITRRVRETTSLHVAGADYPMYREYWQLQLDVNVRRALLRAWRPTVVRERLTWLGGIVGAITLLFGGIGVFFRLKDRQRPDEPLDIEQIQIETPADREAATAQAAAEFAGLPPDRCGTWPSSGPRRRWWKHALVFALVNSAIIAAVAIHNGADDDWVNVITLGWGIGLVAHGFGAFRRHPRRKSCGARRPSRRERRQARKAEMIA